MGIDIDVRLVYGWEVTYEDVLKFMRVVGLSEDDDPDDCEDHLPNGIHLYHGSPYCDAGYDSSPFFVSLISERETHMSSDRFNQVSTMENQHLGWECVCRIRGTEGATFEPATIRAVPHVW